MSNNRKELKGNIKVTIETYTYDLYLIGRKVNMKKLMFSLKRKLCYEREWNCINCYKCINKLGRVRGVVCNRNRFCFLNESYLSKSVRMTN